METPFPIAELQKCEIKIRAPVNGVEGLCPPKGKEYDTSIIGLISEYKSLCRIGIGIGQIYVERKTLYHNIISQVGIRACMHACMELLLLFTMPWRDFSYAYLTIHIHINSRINHHPCLLMCLPL